jgi:hypothetical protein
MVLNFLTLRFWAAFTFFSHHAAAIRGLSHFCIAFLTVSIFGSIFQDLLVFEQHLWRDFYELDMK